MKKSFLSLLVVFSLLIAFSGCRKSEHVKTGYDTGVAKLYIDFEDGLNKSHVEKDFYLNVKVNFFPFSSNEGDTLRDITGQIKGRGNSTWAFEKKPYKLKMDEKTGFFGRAGEKDWVLLANYSDKTLMRNFLAYRLAEQIGSPHAPSYNFVDVYINGEYNGNYMMTDQIEMKKSRVNLSKLEPNQNDSAEITGGYLMEIDQRAPDKADKPFFQAKRFSIKFRYPKEPSEQQFDYMKDYIEEFENVLYGDNYQDAEEGFRKYFDEKSLITWLIVNEIFKNSDANDFSSMFFFKDRGKRAFMGPVWDFDAAGGNSNHCQTCLDPEGWYVKNNFWYRRLSSDPEFMNTFKQIWNENKIYIDDMIPAIDEMAIRLKYSQKENFKIWPKFSSPSWMTVQGYHSFEEHVDYMKGWFRTRINWLDKEINK